MPDYFLNGRDLAGSAYESEDSENTAIQPQSNLKGIFSPGYTSNQGHSDSDTKWSRGAQPRPYGLADRRDIFSQGLDPDLLKVLGSHVHINGQGKTIFEAAEPGLGASRDRQPAYALAVALQNRLRQVSLPLKKKQEFFSFFGWKFECVACLRTLNPEKFENSTFYLWGPTEPCYVRLRSGPCVDCKEANRRGEMMRECQVVSVKVPPECSC